MEPATLPRNLVRPDCLGARPAPRPSEAVPNETIDQLWTALLVLGLGLTLVGYAWHFCSAFRRSAGWGFGCMLIPGVFFVFIARHFKEVWRPPALILLGVASAYLAFWMLRITY